MSMDSNGKIMWAKHAEIQQANLKSMGGKIGPAALGHLCCLCLSVWLCVCLSV